MVVVLTVLAIVAVTAISMDNQCQHVWDIVTDYVMTTACHTVVVYYWQERRYCNYSGCDFGVFPVRGSRCTDYRHIWQGEGNCCMTEEM